MKVGPKWSVAAAFEGIRAVKAGQSHVGEGYPVNVMWDLQTRCGNRLDTRKAGDDPIGGYAGRPV